MIPRNVIITNIITVVSSVFLVLSCVLNDREKIYSCQALESTFLAIGYIFISAWSGMTTQLVAVARNLIVRKNLFSFPLMIVFAFFTAVFGIAVNSSGFVGLLPVISSVQLTVCNYYAKTIKAIKLSFIINIAIYATYSFLVMDFTSGITESVIGIITVVSLFKLVRGEKNAE